MALALVACSACSRRQEEVAVTPEPSPGSAPTFATQPPDVDKAFFALVSANARLYEAPRRGDLDAVLPFGTYQLRVLGLVRVEPQPV